MRELSIDWAALHSAFQMNMPEVRCFLSVEDGRVLKLPPGDPGLATVRGDPQRYIAIEAIPSRIQYQWLAEFINSVTDEQAKGRMEAAINGKGAFRRFKDILLAMPEERRRWFEYRDQMMRRRIVEWVQEQGINPSNAAPWLENEGYGNGEYMADATQTASAALAHSVAHNSLPPPPSISHLGSSLDMLGPDAEPPASAPSASSAGMLAAPSMGPPMLHVAPAVPDNVGNVAPSGAGFGRRVAPANHPHEIEALRDFLIEWSDHRSSVPSSSTPLELEELASEIAKRFQVRSVHP